MTTADELLTAGNVLWIDVETRLINIPSGVKILGVMSDDDVQKLNFAMPRYYNDIDLSEYDININYENAKNEGDVYFVTNAVVDTDTITFTWIVGRYATAYTGDVKFIVCLKKLNNDDEIESEFNTTIATLPVLKGLETGTAVAEAERDALASIARMAIEEALDSDLRGEPGYTPVKGTDYYTETEKEELVTEVIQHHNSVTANSFTGTAKGEVVRVDDVNPIEHSVKAKIYGKNLLPDSVYDQSKWALVEGTTNNYVFPLALKECETYTFSATMIDGSFGYFYIEKSNDGFLTNNDTWLSTPNNWCMPLTFTTEKGFEYRLFWFEGKKFVTDLATNFQLELGDTATEYEPYIDPTSVTVKTTGTNIATFPYSETSKTRAGITYTVGDDGTIVYDGVSTGSYLSLASLSDEKLYLIRGVTYTMSGFLSDSSMTTTYAHITENDDVTRHFLTNDKTTFTAETSGWAKFTLVVSEGTTVDHGIFKPMLEIGENASSFESYTGATYTPSSDGTCEIVSVSPTMTVLTDTPGVTIECEYGADTNTALRDLERALDNIIAVQEALIGGGTV